MRVSLRHAWRSNPACHFHARKVIISMSGATGAPTPSSAAVAPDDLPLVENGCGDDDTAFTPAGAAAPGPAKQPLDVSVVVPTRNAESLIEDCLASIQRSSPRQLVVVDGLSTDRTVEIARRHGATVLSDEGRGLPAARRMGAETASAQQVALIDVDVRLGEGDLERLLIEFRDGRYAALQAGLHSVSGP